MASGNRWQLHEFVLCLDLYLKEGPVGNTHPRVTDLARDIGRTSGAIALRLANFQYVDENDGGPGMSGGEKDCQPIWDLLADKPEIVSGLAAVCRQLLEGR